MPPFVQKSYKIQSPFFFYILVLNNGLKSVFAIYYDVKVKLTFVLLDIKFLHLKLRHYVNKPEWLFVPDFKRNFLKVFLTYCLYKHGTECRQRRGIK